MQDFVKKVIEGTGISPPEICLPAFYQNFENAFHVDWFDRGDFFEAVFYRDSLEHIALFTSEGSLFEYKLYLPEGYLPESIKNYLEERGEIMNAVLKNKGNAIEYEVIVRDKELNRYLIILSDLGKVLADTKL